MPQRLIALGAALTFAASSIVHAAPLPSASATVPKSAGGQTAAAAWVDPPAKMPAKPLSSVPTAPPAATTQSPAAISEPAKPAAQPQTHAAAQPVGVRVEAKEPMAARQAAPASAARVAAPVRQATKPHVVRTARYAGGEGGAWRTGRDSFGFAGMFGGCRISGFAGPNGYRINRVC